MRTVCSSFPFFNLAFPMSELIYEELPLEACLNLLRGEEDEKKMAGLLMAVKYLKPTVCYFYIHYLCIG